MEYECMNRAIFSRHQVAALNGQYITVMKSIAACHETYSLST
jgi:hypothetical protein